MCETELFLNVANVTPLLEREFKAGTSIGGNLDPNYVLNECFWYNDNQVIPINDPKIDLSDIYLVHDEDFVVNDKKDIIMYLSNVQMMSIGIVINSLYQKLYKMLEIFRFLYHHTQVVTVIKC